MNANRDTLDCPPQLAADAARLKRHFPFRICWAAPHGTRNGEPDSTGGYALKHRWL